MRNPSICTIVALLAGLEGCSRDLEVEQVSDSGAQGGNRQVTTPDSGGSYLSSAGSTATSVGSAGMGGAVGLGGTSNLVSTAGQAGATSIGGTSNSVSTAGPAGATSLGGTSNSVSSAAPAGAPSLGGMSGSGGNASGGVAGYFSGGTAVEAEWICRMHETTEMVAPLPQDPSTFKSMTYEMCLNGSCARLLPGTEQSSWIVVGGGVGLNIVEPTKNINLTMTFWFLALPCSTGCVSPNYQMRATASADPNSSLVDGDIWRLTILDGDGTVFYQHSAIATYTMKRLDGLGDFTAYCANCRTLSVPASGANDPTAGCRAPGEPGCSECCEKETSTAGTPMCVRHAAQAGWSDWYNISQLEGETCASTCATCAQCSLHEEQELRALVKPVNCDCSTTDIGIDACIAPSSCECYCERYLVGIRNCPQLSQ
ncbi:MAG TPA: hypothetical protein VIV60_10475 [Polyangiaceae bacterium]